ncbi:MAG: EVE domain-containing protein [Proteobacteria bacterium]|nr:EVE domain-containing protein [Pseudomonadota bacterium]
MKYWLVKSEPNTWSWDDHVKAGVEPWDGIRNYQADNNMKEMRIGDKAFFYHSVKEKQIVGVVEVVKEHYPDDTDPKGIFGRVDFKALYPVETPVTLADIKADERLNHLLIVRHTRLSVVPIDAKAWKVICKLAGVKP